MAWRSWSMLLIVALISNVFLLLNNMNQTSTPEPPKQEIRKLDLPPDDFKTMVDYHDFDYLITKPRCEFKKDLKFNETLPYFITFVHSKPTNFEVRNTMVSVLIKIFSVSAKCFKFICFQRDTWAHVDKRTKTYFLLGAVNSPDLQKSIEKENAEYNDIIQGNFMDTYRNLTYKHMMALKWFNYNCPDANYMVKMDDTVFVNMPNVYKFLTNNSEATRTGLLMGPFFRSAWTPREGKFAVTPEEYETKYFPNYAEKFALIYSNDVAYKLYKRAQKMRFFWIDDVFITGLVRIQLNIKLTDMRKYLIDRSNIDRLKKFSTNLPRPANFMFTYQYVDMEEQRLLWEKTEWSRLDLNLDRDE